MRSGDLDTLITIEQRTEVQDATLGTYSYSWAEYARPWADVREVLGGERIAQSLNLANRNFTVEMRYLDGFTGDMRVVIGGETCRIVSGPIELGRRDGHRFACEVLSTGGIEP